MALVLFLVRPDASAATDAEIDRLLKKLPPPEKLVKPNEQVVRVSDPALRDPLVKQIEAAAKARQSKRALELARQLATRYPSSAAANYYAGYFASERKTACGSLRCLSPRSCHPTPARPLSFKPQLCRMAARSLQGRAPPHAAGNKARAAGRGGLGGPEHVRGDDRPVAGKCHGGKTFGRSGTATNGCLGSVGPGGEECGKLPCRGPGNGSRYPGAARGEIICVEKISFAKEKEEELAELPFLSHSGSAARFEVAIAGGITVLKTAVENRRSLDL